MGVVWGALSATNRIVGAGDKWRGKEVGKGDGGGERSRGWKTPGERGNAKGEAQRHARDWEQGEVG